MKIEWKVDDGYVGHGSQYTEIDEDELADCETEDDVQKLIRDCVKTDFEYQVTFAYTDDQSAKVMQRWEELKAEQAEEEDE